MRRSYLLIVALGLAACETSDPLPPAPSIPLQYYIDPTDGSVGYHFASGLRVVRGSIPGGYDGCVPQWNSPVLTGSLPPGLTFDPNGAAGANFSGTPKQPGTWRVTLSVTVGCSRGPDQTIYNRTMTATFNISP